MEQVAQHFEVTRRSARRFAVRRGLDPDEVESAWCTALYLASIRYRPDGVASFEGYLVTSLHNATRNLLRGRRPLGFRSARDRANAPTITIAGDGSDEPATDDDPAEVAIAREIEARVARVMRAMASPDRQVLVMHYWEGLTYSQMANRLDVMPSQVDVLMARARGRFRAIFVSSSIPKG